MAVPEPPTDSTVEIEAGLTTAMSPPAETLDIPEATAELQLQWVRRGQQEHVADHVVVFRTGDPRAGTLRSTVLDAAFHDPSQTATSACAGPPDEKPSRPTEPGKQGCQSSKVSAASKFLKANKKTLIAVGACAGGVIAGLAVPGLGLLGFGFGPGGVTAGSAAASIQSLMGGVIVKGSLFATMQSWGAVGIPAAFQSLFTACGGATGLGTATLLMKHKKKQTCKVCECSKACKCCEACKCTGTSKCREACKCNESCKHSETCKCNETCKHSETCKCSEAGEGGEAIKTASLQGQ